MVSPHPAPPRPRQLRRLPDDGHIAGVCAGVAQYFAIDPVIVRIAAVVLAVTGPGIIAYVLAWIFVPEGDGEGGHGSGAHGTAGHNPLGHLSSDKHERGGQIFGIVLLAVAVSILWGGWWSPMRRWMFPTLLIGLGLWLILRHKSDGTVDVSDTDLVEPRPAAPWSAPRQAVGQAVDDSDGDDGATPSDVASAMADTTAGAPDDTTVLPEADAAGGPGSTPPPPPWGEGPWGTGALHQPEPLEVAEARRAARRRRRMVLPVVMGALAVWTGLAFLTGVSLESGLAIALCIVGVGFVLGAFVGGSKLLILPALLLGGALVVTSVVDVPLRGPMGQRTWAPETVDDLDDPYELSIGEGTLDLTDLPLDPGEPPELRATVGIGHLVVVLPEGVAASVRARSGVGETMLDERSDTGVSVSSDRVVGDADAEVSVRLDLQVGVGQVEVVIDRDEQAKVRPAEVAPPDPTTSPDPAAPPGPTTASTLR